jgi:hypothetical protein
MPTANNTPASGVKPARRTTSPKARSRSTASKATRAKSARTRAANQTASAVRQSQLANRDTADVFGDYAERAVLIPVGAALIARDRVVASVSDTISSYSSPSRAQAQLKRFERRGATARNRLEREVRKTRVRVERKLRQRRRNIEKSVEKSVSDLEARRDAVTKNGSEIANRVPELANRVQERLLNLV